MNIWLLTILAVYGCATIAEEITTFPQSEFLHQTETGRFDFNTGLSLVSEEYKVRTSGADVTQDVYHLALGGEYGISDRYALGLALDLGTGERTTPGCGLAGGCDDDVGGMTDPALYLKSRFPIGPGLLRVVGELTFSLASAEIRDNGDSNLASGGNAFNLLAAYEIPFGRNLVGVSIARDLHRGERDFEDNSGVTNTRATVTGGERTSYTLFYELKLNPRFMLGIAGVRTQSPETDSKIANVTTPDDNEYERTDLVLYAPVSFKNGAAVLLPSVTWGNLEYADSAAALDDHSSLAIGCAARFTLDPNFFVGQGF